MVVLTAVAQGHEDPSDGSRVVSDTPGGNDILGVRPGVERRLAARSHRADSGGMTTS